MCGCLCVGGVNRIIWLPFGCAMQQPAPSNTSHVKPITYHSLFGINNALLLDVV